MRSDASRLSAEEFSLVLPRLAGPAHAAGRPTLRLADIVADAERNAIRSALAAADGRRSLPRSCSASRAPRLREALRPGAAPRRLAALSRAGDHRVTPGREGRLPALFLLLRFRLRLRLARRLLVRGELPDDGVVLGRRGIGRVRVRLADRLVLGDVGLMQSW